MYSSGNIDVRNWVHLFESPCINSLERSNCVCCVSGQRVRRYAIAHNQQQGISKHLLTVSARKPNYCTIAKCIADRHFSKLQTARSWNHALAGSEFLSTEVANRFVFSPVKTLQVTKKASYFITFHQLLGGSNEKIRLGDIRVENYSHNPNKEQRLTSQNTTSIMDIYFI